MEVKASNRTHAETTTIRQPEQCATRDKEETTRRRFQSTEREAYKTRDARAQPKRLTKWTVGQRIKTTIHYRQSRLRPSKLSQGGDWHYHDILSDPKGSTRIFFQNVGGLATEDAVLKSNFSALKSFRVAYAGLQETKVNTQNYGRVGQVCRACLGAFGKEPVLHSNTYSRMESRYQPGGLATLTDRTLRTGVDATEKDPTSLVQKTYIRGGMKKLMILNVYVPPPTIGALSTYTQSVNTIREKNTQIGKVDVAAYVYKMIHSELQKAVEAGFSVIVGGDFNDTHHEQSRMTKQLEGAGMINATSPPGSDGPSASRRPGNRVIDHIWITQDLVQFVTAFGYLPFGLGMQSDHRGLFVDVKIMQHEPPPLPRWIRRKLDSKNVCSVERYLKSVRRLVKAHTIEETITKLEACPVFDEGQAEALDRVDEVLTTILLSAESKLKRVRTSDLFSAPLHLLKLERHYWRKILNLRDSVDHFALRQIHGGHKEQNINMTRREILRHLWDVGTRITKARHRSETLRERMLQDIAEKTPAKYDLGGSQVKGNVNALKNAEKMKRKFEKLRKLKHPRETTGSKVQVPKAYHTVDNMWSALKERREDPGKLEWDTIEDEEQVAEYLLHWCVRHFSQACDTPLATQEWREKMDPEIAGHVLEGIKNGTFKLPPGYPPEMVQFFAASKLPNDRPEVPDEFEFQHFQEFCRRQDEKKTSSPSGLHYGHLKALLWDETLLRLKFRILKLAYTRGVMLSRWRKIWEVLLKKDKKTTYIHRFRNITLVEGDIQFLMKCLWSQRLMRSVTPFLNKQQNATKGRVTQSSILSHRVALDLMFLNGERSIITESDVANCYDRILRHIATMALSRAGMTGQALSFFQEFLRQARHYLLLSGKQSEGCFADSAQTPVEGSGQGTGWSPPVWLLIADIILKALEDNQPGLFLTSPDGSTTDFRAAEKHVDDSRQGVNEAGVEKFNNEHMTNLTLEEAATAACQAFERYLALTGGRLAIEKTMVHAIYPDLDGRGKRYKSKGASRLSISITENFSTTGSTLRQYAPDKAHKLLGVYTDPSSENVEQINYMTEQATTWARRMRTSTLPARLKLLSFEFEFKPQMRYPLPAVSLTQEQVTEIIKPAMPAMKNAIGIARTTPSSAMFFPSQYGGYGLEDFHLTKIVLQTKYVIQHLRNKDSAGRRIKILICAHQLEAGIPTQFERGDVRRSARYITSSIILDLLADLEGLGARLVMHHWVPPTNGKAIMQDLIQKGVSDDCLAKVNRVRTWLQVHDLQDISLTDASGIHPGYVTGERVRPSAWKWPKWGPGKDWKETWKTVLATYLKPNFPITRGIKRSHQTQVAQMDVDTGTIRVGQDLFTPVARIRRPPLVSREGLIFNQRTTVPCDVWASGGRTRLLAKGGQAKRERGGAQRADTFRDALLKSEPGLARYLRDLPTSDGDCEVIKRLIEEDDLVTGSDGSALFSERATFAVTMASRDLTAIHTSAHETMGYPYDSGRAELFGILVLAVYIEAFTRVYRLGGSNAIPMYCDNKEAVRFAQDPWIGATPKWADSRNIDLKRRLAKILEENPGLLRVEHVAAHQDQKKPVEELGLPARVNMICDQACHELLLRHKEDDAVNEKMPALTTNEVTLVMEDEAVTEPIRQRLERTKYADKVTEYLHIDKHSFREIDWAAHEAAVKTVDSQAVKRILWGHHPTRARLHMQRRHGSPNCPLCGEKDLADHFVHCPAVNRSREYREIEREQSHRAHAKGCPDHMVNTIRQVMRGVHKSPRRQKEATRKAYEAQTKIGWYHFRRARIAKAWSEYKTGGAQDSDTGFRRDIARIILTWLLEKWKVRCSHVEKSSGAVERGRLLGLCHRIWSRRGEIDLLPQDRHLMATRSEPSETQTLEYLRAWRRAVEIAAKAHKTYQKARAQPTIRRWLRPLPEKRRDKDRSG